MLGNLPGGAGEELACWAICDSNILLLVVNKSTLEANYLITQAHSLA